MSGAGATAPVHGGEPDPDCRRCERLAAFRDANRQHFPGWFNAPVPSFGDPDPLLLIVGLAPGLRGANRSGRPFTGDAAGEMLFATLARLGLATGTYGARADDGFTLRRCRIANAVRCVPPENRPSPAEVRSCNPFLAHTIMALPRLRAIVALGAIAHQATLLAFDARRPAHPFAHGAIHRLPRGLILADSYHCSRQNTNTGRLTADMLESVFRGVLPLLDG